MAGGRLRIYQTLDPDAHPEATIDFKVCSECGVERDAIYFEVLLKRGGRGGTWLAEVCLSCERKAGVAG